MRWVTKAAEGQGSCPGKWEPARLVFKSCNKHACPVKADAGIVKCTKNLLDIVLVVDGSGSLGQDGWTASKVAAQKFVSAFEGKDTEARLSVILFSGPTNWGDVRKCYGMDNKANQDLDVAKTCNIQTVEHFTKDLAEAKKKIGDMKWPKGSTLTSLALTAAQNEITIGRGDARAIVVVITDGKPMSPRRTKRASMMLRKTARLIWVPVTKFAPLKQIRQWATRRWQENVVVAKKFSDLTNNGLLNKLVADMCPEVDAA